MTYETFAAGILAAVAILAIYGLRIQHEANNWYSIHTGEFLQLQRKIRGRFNKQVVAFVKAVGTKTKNAEERQRNANEVNFVTKIEALYQILSEEKELNDTYEAIRSSRRKEGGAIAVLAIFLAANSFLLLAQGDIPIITQNATGQSQLAPPILVLVLLDVIAGFFLAEWKKSHDTHDQKMDWYLKKIKDEEIDASTIPIAQKSNQSNNET